MNDLSLTMFCPKCGKELTDDSSFCPGCGSRVGSNPPPGNTVYTDQTSGNNVYNTQGPKEPSTLGPFLLGLILGIIGVIIAVLIYNGNDGPYTKDPTTHALLWSVIGMFIWIPILFGVIFVLFLSGA